LAQHNIGIKNAEAFYTPPGDKLFIHIDGPGWHVKDNLQYLPAMENRRKNKTQNYNKDLAIKWQDTLKEILVLCLD